MSTTQKFELSASQLEAAHAIVDLGLNQDVQLKALTLTLFTPEVVADKAAYNAARNAMQTHAIVTRGMQPDSARTFVYRLLQRAEVEAPGKNAGAANGKAAETSAKTAEVEAIAAQGLKAAIKAIEVALTVKDYSKARKIVDALQAADKAAGKAVETPAAA